MPQINQPAPLLEVDQWVQGRPTNLDQHLGKVILVEVFQVNCPGCFIGGLPEAIDIYLKNKDKPLEVFGLATAFEDFRLNSLENLKRLIDTGEVIGESHRNLAELNMLSMGRLQYFIPFPVAWDQVVARDGTTTPEEIMGIVNRDFPQYQDMPEANQNWVREQIAVYLKQKEYDAKTFDTYQLKGTPSAILIDKKGMLRHNLFGSGQDVAGHVERLLAE